MDGDVGPALTNVRDTSEEVECVFSFAKPSTSSQGGRNTGKDEIETC